MDSQLRTKAHLPRNDGVIKESTMPSRKQLTQQTEALLNGLIEENPEHIAIPSGATLPLRSLD